MITFGDVLFDTGKADLKYGSQRNFEQLAKFLNDNPERKLRVDGLTDTVGIEGLNLSLSERRADMFAMTLSRQGVAHQALT